MRAADYIHAVNRRAALYHFLSACPLMAAVLVPPLGVALALGELDQALRLASSAGAVFGVGLLRRWVAPHPLGIREAMAITALSYLAFALLGAITLSSTLAPLDALFEAMSGITTTGLSVLDVRAAPPSILFFRAYLQWLGGAGIMVLALAVVTHAGRSAVSLFRSSPAHHDLIGSVRETARSVAGIYGVLTAAAFLARLAAGAAPWPALLYTLSLVSTGGFAPDMASAAALPGVGAILSCVPFMLIGATSFPLLHRLGRGRWRAMLDDPQPWVLLALFGAAATLLWWRGGHPTVEAVFHATSAATGSGFTVSSPATWTESARALVIPLFIIGGASASTSGGIKLWRFILVLKSAARGVVSASLPREARLPFRYRNNNLDRSEERALTSFLMLYLLLLASATATFVVSGFDPLDALFECASALGTVGMSVGITTAGMPAHLELVLITLMWMGRLEILPVLLVLYLRTWVTKGDST